MMLDPVGKLCARAQSGDTAAASELISLFHERIFSYFRRQCSSNEYAEDLTQKTFCKVWASIASFRGRSSVATWIHGIAYHVYVDWRRRRNLSDPQTDDWWETRAADAPSPFESAAGKEAAEHLYRWVGELDDDDRDVVHLHYFQGLSLSETAEALDIATSTVKYRLRAALKFLREKTVDLKLNARTDTHQEGFMNEAQIENLLRHSPRLDVPGALEAKLRENIRLPKAPIPESAIVSWLPFKRWLPITLCLAIGLTAIAIQLTTRSCLEKEKIQQLAAAQPLEKLRQENAEYKKLKPWGDDINRLRKDGQELRRLREEIASLEAETTTLEKLRAENEKLEHQAGAGAGGTKDFFAEAQEHAELVTCINNLKQVGLSARIWANDHQGVFPIDYISMKNEMGTPKILRCPSDKTRPEITWDDVAAGNVSYPMLAPGARETEAQVIFAECPIHRNFCLVDGSVQHLTEETVKNFIKVINGKKTIQRIVVTPQ